MKAFKYAFGLMAVICLASAVLYSAYHQILIGAFSIAMWLAIDAEEVKESQKQDEQLQDNSRRDN